MNRINQLFQKKKTTILSIYFTAGYPELNSTVKIIKQLEKSGIDMLEIGMPFSDPLADGKTIQDTSQVALKNGMTVKKLFEQLKDIRNEVSIPLILMGYFNPVYQYGIERFCQKCKETGIDGLIIPDLPLDEFQEKYQKIFEENNLHNIFLITPQTTDKRIKQIDTISKGFIYMVSSASTTGAKKDISDEQIAYFKRIKELKLTTPQIIGFGISDNKTFKQACQYANGAIIGSAFVKILKDSPNLEDSINLFTKKILDK